MFKFLFCLSEFWNIIRKTFKQIAIYSVVDFWMHPCINNVWLHKQYKVNEVIIFHTSQIFRACSTIKEIEKRRYLFSFNLSKYFPSNLTWKVWVWEWENILEQKYTAFVYKSISEVLEVSEAKFLFFTFQSNVLKSLIKVPVFFILFINTTQKSKEILFCATYVYFRFIRKSAANSRTMQGNILQFM